MPNAVGVIKKTLEVPNHLHLINQQVNEMQQRVENIQKNVEELSKFNVELNRMLIELEQEEDKNNKPVELNQQNMVQNTNFSFL